MFLPNRREAGVHGAGLLALSLLGVVIGVITGFGAILFRMLISVVHNLFFLGELSTAYDANVFTSPSPWGAAIVFAPVLGGVVVTFLVTRYAPEARGHGVPEVMDAVFYNEGRIRPAVAAVKSLASAFSIGSGASVGREGPIIQIGASLGSTIGGLVRMQPWQRITLVAAGAGAGIAATFNTPIGGVLFAIELMLPEVSVRTFLPVALATGTATWISHIYLGMSPAFLLPNLPTPELHATSLVTLLLYAGLGVLAGLTATAFIRGLHASEGVFARIGNPYARHALGTFGVGVMIYALFLWQGHYFVEGVGYSTVQSILLGGTPALSLLSVLLVAKLAATCLSLGSGASGGVFSPSLFIGAALGGAVAALLIVLFPHAGFSLPAFATVGMAAVVGGGTGAAMTAVTMIFEMTRNYEIVMPMIVAVAVSVGVRRVLSRENIYTIKLVARRHFLPKSLHASMFLVRRAVEVADRDFVAVPGGQSLGACLRTGESGGDTRYLVVARGQRIAGVLRVSTILRHPLDSSGAGTPLGTLASRRYTIAHENDIMFDVIRRMWRRGASMTIVVRDGVRVPHISDVVGIIAKEHVADSVAESIRPYESAQPMV
ncbi:MAG TPA: chloride channel protein [Woeseiaceae bacterium]